jgi:hypothetical protein
MKILTLTFIGLAIWLSSCNTEPVTLQYAKQDIQSAKYEIKYFQNSEAKMNDEPMTAQYKLNIPFEISSSRDKTGVKANITIPKTDVKIVLPTGQQTLDTRNLKNIKLDVSYTPKGDEKKITLHDKSMVIDFGEMLGGKMEWSYLFKYITPNLPEEAITVGYTWNEKKNLKRIESASKINSTLVFKHKIKDFENIDGRKCAVIESQISSKLDDTFELMAMPWNLKGELTGNMIWYFDYEQGLIVKLKIDEKSNGAVESSGGEMSATYTQATTIELNLLN